MGDLKKLLVGANKVALNNLERQFFWEDQKGKIKGPFEVAQSLEGRKIDESVFCG